MVTAVILLIAGSPFYQMNKPQGSLLIQVFGGIWVSLFIIHQINCSAEANIIIELK